MAIAYDNSLGTQSGIGVTPFTFAYTTGGGSDRFMVIYTFPSQGGTVTSLTYNGVGATQLSTGTGTIGVGSYYIHYLVAPATGANNITISGTNTGRYIVRVATYTGVDQTSPINTSQSGSGTGNFTSTFATTIDNCWKVMCAEEWQNGGTLVAGTNSTQRAGGIIGIFDTNGAITPAGSSAMSISVASGGDTYSYFNFAFKPLVPSAIKTINGLAIASVKTVNGLAIASVKTWNGLA